MRWNKRCTRDIHSIRGVACLKFNARNCGGVANAFMQTQIPKGDIYKYGRPIWDAPGFVLFGMLSIFLVTVDNTKSYMNQDLFHIVNGCYTLKGGRRADITPAKLELDTLELPFHPHYVRASSRNLQNWDKIIPCFLFKCVFAYMVLRPCLCLYWWPLGNLQPISLLIEKQTV